MNDVILSVQSLIGKPGDIVTVPIFIENAPDQDVVKDVVSLDLLLTYDPTLVSIVDPNPDTDENEAVRLAGISANWSIEGTPNPVVNIEESGTIDIALIKDPTSPPNTDSDTILEIDFTIAEEAEFGSRTPIDLQADEAQSRIGIGDQDSPIDDESLEDGEIVVAELSIDDVSLEEGNEGNTEFNFTVSLSESLNQAVTVDYATADDTAIAGEDYTATSGTLTFAPGEPPTQTISVDVIGETTVEDDQTFFVNLSNFSGGAIADAQGVGTITNDDIEIFIIDDVERNEGDTEFTFTVFLSEASNETVTVDYATEDGTATAGEDYTATSGTLTFEPGQTTPETISVPILNDEDFEVDEAFNINLSNATNATISDGQGIGIIANEEVDSLAPDDQGAIPGSLSLSDTDDSYIYKDEDYFYDFYTVPVDGSISSDDTIDITLTSNDFRPLLMILNSEGQVISVGQSPNETTSTITSFDVPDTPFFLSVETFEADAQGDYQLDIDIL